MADALGIAYHQCAGNMQLEQLDDATEIIRLVG